MDFTFLPNYFTIGSLISTLFFSFMCYVFLRIKNPSKASIHLLFMVSFMALFNISYVVTHGFSGVPNIWTRWTNIVMALLGATHACLFFFYYPNPRNEKIAKIFFYSQYSISFIVSIFVLVSFWGSPFYYIFNSHFWDSDTMATQQIAGLIIFIFFLISFGLGILRSIQEKGDQRKIVLIFTFSMAIVMMLPGIFHVLSRDGLMERSAYMSSTVIFNLVGFFFIIITFINNTTDRTTILVRLIGVSVVTLLLILQISSFFWLKNVEDSFDQVHISLAKESFVEDIHHPKENYRLVYSLESDKLTSKLGNIESIDLTARTQFNRNTAYYYKLSKLGDDLFTVDAKRILSQTNGSFKGYRGWLEKALEDELITNPSEFTDWIANHTNRIRYLNSKLRAIPEDQWDEKKESFLKNVDKSLPGFMSAIQEAKSIDNLTKRDIELQLIPIIKPETRNFSGSISTDGKDIPTHSIVYSSIIHLDDTTKIVETGFNYKYYRENIAESSWTLIIIIISSYLFILLGFKFFFGGALLVPIQTLVDGLTQVNEGNLDVNLKIKVEDEIGFMTKSFNNMTWSIKSSQLKLQEYAEQLEQKVEERTRELSDTLKKVQELKTQQDGDYFLTTLLLEPLGHSEIQSKLYSLESYVKQKKQFTFRKWSNNIGGDINIAQQVILNGKSHIVFVNADAMGKSMQGAGGALVMGSVFHTILDRTEMTPTMQMMYPERWLKNLFVELHKVFESFNGSMLMSGFFGVLDEDSGFLYYLNCEHPQGVLYRDGKASFFEKDVVLRKLGTSSVEGNLKIETF
ncbi:MAG: SpoIIE family protein phosphatase, partial [Leptospira sp.]|nr:SpoIIE family protein phosphatase [Leptospira sp.]